MHAKDASQYVSLFPFLKRWAVKCNNAIRTQLTKKVSKCVMEIAKPKRECQFWVLLLQAGYINV